MTEIEILSGTELYIDKVKCVAVPDSELRGGFACHHCILEDSPLCNHVAFNFDERHDRESIHFEKVI